MFDLSVEDMAEEFARQNSGRDSGIKYWFYYRLCKFLMAIQFIHLNWVAYRAKKEKSTMKIYVIYGSSGDYSDHSQWSVIAVRDAERAEKLVSDLKVIESVKCALAKKEHEEWEKPYNELNPTPQQYYEKGRLAGTEPPRASNEYKRLQTIPKDLKTEEDRARFKELNRQHQKAIDKWKDECKTFGEMVNSHQAKKLEDRQVWRQQNWRYPEHLIETIRLVGLNEIPTGNISMYSDTSYSFEELELAD